MRGDNTSSDRGQRQNHQGMRRDRVLYERGDGYVEVWIGWWWVLAGALAVTAVILFVAVLTR